jgi:flagellar protein FliS
MLIEGAIRFCRQTLQLWEEEKFEEALEPLARARGVVSELLSSIRPDKTGLTQKVAGVYLFIFNSLTKAQLQRNPKTMEEAIEVLEVERETWQLVCEKLPHAPVPAQPTEREISAAEAAEKLSQSASVADPNVEGTSPGGLVLDA